jgi:peptide/nickel transport system substrate-binding protein
LYIYGNSSRGMWSVLEAIYDGPFDTRQSQPQPVILEQPTSALLPVEMKAGDLIVDANGDLKSLEAGVKVLPSGCSSAGCIQTWDGKKALKLDQLKVTFRLLPGLTWSDGAPLTAADSVYSFTVASAPETPVSRRVIDRTVTYQAADERTVEWVGLPGYLPARLDTLFFVPLPKHALEKISPADLLKAPDSNLRPLGWGPYVLESWKPGQSITLHKNANYFRSAQGLPKFDTLVFRFFSQQGKANLEALLAGQCDLVDQTALLDDQLRELVDLSNARKIALVLGQGPEWEHLDFGIRPASYADGLTAGKDRPDFFGDVRVRKAFAACIDRQKIVQTLFFNRAQIPAGYLAPDSALFQPGLAAVPFDPAAGARLLEEAGWQLPPGGGPRLSQGSSGVPKGTPFAVNYATTDTPLRRSVALIVQQSLAQCGIQVTPQFKNLGELFAPGPEGPLFGRSFDLAQFAWDAGSQPACFLYETGQIPAPQNSWIGANITGYTSPAWDAACQQARLSRPGQAGFAAANQEAERLFAEELPVIPLYFRLKIAISRPDLCGLALDPSARSALWNLEAFDTGATCQ